MAGVDTSGSMERLPNESMVAYLARLREAEVRAKRPIFERWAQRNEQRRRNIMATSASRGAEPMLDASSSAAAANTYDLPLRDSQPLSQTSLDEGDLQDLLKSFGARKTPLNRGKLSQPAQQASSGNSSAGSSRMNTPGSSRRSSVRGTEKERPNKGKSASMKPPLKKSADNVRASNRRGPLAGSSNATGKRLPSTNPSVSCSKIDLEATGKIPKKTSNASPQSPDRASSAEAPGGIDAAQEERPPRWYQSLARPNKRNPNQAGVSLLLERLTAAISKRDVGVVRDTIHALAFQLVDGPVLKGTSMLTTGNGLSKLFDADSMNGKPWPYDIRADAQELYNKWCRKIFETDLLRGIQLKSRADKEHGDRNNDRIIKGWFGKVDFHAFGHNELSNGQWFPTQLTTVRDGAHGASQGGICGKTKEGAYSCIMTGQSGYPDEDGGEEVLYCGTDSDDGNVTANTQLMLDNITSGNPVRFIRKSTLKSRWAPEVGYRYDGLYDVKDYKILVVKDNPKAARHRFRLVRRPGQDPIRGGKGPDARPTEQEIERYQQDKRFR